MPSQEDDVGESGSKGGSEKGEGSRERVREINKRETTVAETFDFFAKFFKFSRISVARLSSLSPCCCRTPRLATWSFCSTQSIILYISRGFTLCQLFFLQKWHKIELLYLEHTKK